MDVQQPPWATELLVRNRKVARNIWSSLDSDNGSDCGVGGGDMIILSSNSSNGIEEERRTMVKRGMTTNMKMGKVVDPVVGIPSSSAYIRMNSEKSAPIRDEAADDDEEMKGKNAEESILEYGPGIVRKLRSRYQSLALRQSVGRPTLRRSTSLENCLDSVSSEQLSSSDSPSPVPYHHYEDEVDGGRSGVGGGERKNMIVQSNHNRDGSQHYGLNRGRAAYSEYTTTRKDRMKRARSVDALHRPLSRLHEEDQKEILEKFRTVVSPKEEIVIIEVSKPRANISYGGSSESNYFMDDKFNSQQHLYLNNNHGYSGNSSEPNRVRSVTSPEHELPPPDIVRETARIFEKNHDNNQTATNNLLISSIKKVGHALRLSKSSSVSPSSSPLPSPTTTTTTSYTTMMNGQIDGNSYQNKNHLTAQGSNTLTAANQQKFNRQQPESFHRDKNFIVNGSTTSSNFSPHKSSPTTNNFVANHHSISPNKQIGVIRPNVITTPVTTTGPVVAAPINGVISSSSSSSKANVENSAPKRISPIDVSPIQISNNSSASTPINKFIHHHSNKPPLSPKPLFTSSPKNIFLVNSNHSKTGGGGKMTESSINNSNNDNAKSPEEPYDGHLNFDSHRVGGKSSATTATIPSTVQIHGLIPNGNSNFRNMSMSTEKSPPPPDKENKEQKEIMEFQKISLKPVAKPSEHSEIILTNGTTTIPNNNSTKNKMNISTNKTNNESKTEKKDQKSNAKQQQGLPKSVVTTVPTFAPLKTESLEPKIGSKGNVEQQQQQQQQSQLRAHQKQKLQQANHGNGSQMVFNFTNRQKVPDYIEDDGLHSNRIPLGGAVTDESQDDDADGQGWSEDDHVDARLIQFVGANVIINGRSSIQKKPKSQKLNISFNEDATTTFEYPSEASILGDARDDDTNDNGKDTLLGHKSPNILNTSGGGLGSYIPSKTGKTYQLGNTTTPKKSESSVKKEDNTTELIEDYLKPDEGSTTWSNEIGADILF